MKGFLLDTMTISEGAKRRSNAGLAQWLNAQNPNLLFLSALTLGEIQHGISRLPPASERREKLSRWLVHELIPEFGQRILPFDLQAALTWGTIVGEASVQGITLPTVDAQIGATAKLHGLTLVTRNARHFEPCSIKTIDPWT